ncbi:hypothetical protein KP509_07G072500 [Ceratopteris richardii]|uniref:Uncharacterized protein n=1 Tax=Ceratopteris richardii TaxID=49495 RepID=A0A8T2UC31_CERRI|nr:hypothetical protein KP509_07G072500 [Ceratopteris richardii]
MTETSQQRPIFCTQKPPLSFVCISHIIPPDRSVLPPRIRAFVHIRCQLPVFEVSTYHRSMLNVICKQVYLGGGGQLRVRSLRRKLSEDWQKKLGATIEVVQGHSSHGRGGFISCIWD